MVKRENDDKLLSKRYQSLVSEWSNPALRKQGEPALRKEIRNSNLETLNKFKFTKFKFLKNTILNF